MSVGVVRASCFGAACSYDVIDVVKLGCASFAVLRYISGFSYLVERRHRILYGVSMEDP